MSDEGFKLVGYKNFRRNNPRTDRFPIHRFHHIEFWCSDATNVYKRFQVALGMNLVAKSDQSTGNSAYASYALQSNELVFAFTAPYAKSVAHNSTPGKVPLSGYSADTAFAFIVKHGLAVRSVGVVVDDAAEAFRLSVAHGAFAVQSPVKLGEDGPGQQVMSEVVLYGDVVLRFISGDHENPYLAGYERVVLAAPSPTFGIQRLDHAVGNVPNLEETIKHIMQFTGFHEFAEFVAMDIGTLDSGLNSVVLASNNEYVLLPINEPTFGTKRKSQIQTYLEQNEGAGLQHLALKTNDIFHTLRKMRAVVDCGGFEFVPRPSDAYYKELPTKVDGALTAEQLAACEELGILVDRDDQGVLLQIFSKPLGDRSTVFLEVIQRVGCTKGQPLHVPATTSLPSSVPQHAPQAEGEAGTAAYAQAPRNEPQSGGCGGFGKGNFAELFKRIEDYERTLNV